MSVHRTVALSPDNCKAKGEQPKPQSCLAVLHMLLGLDWPTAVPLKRVQACHIGAQPLTLCITTNSLCLLPPYDDAELPSARQHQL